MLPFNNGNQAFVLRGLLFLRIRIPDFPMELYNPDVLFSIGKCVGSPIKLEEIWLASVLKWILPDL